MLPKYSKPQVARTKLIYWVNIAHDYQLNLYADLIRLLLTIICMKEFVYGANPFQMKAFRYQIANGMFYLIGS